MRVRPETPNGSSSAARTGRGSGLVAGCAAAAAASQQSTCCPPGTPAGACARRSAANGCRVTESFRSRAMAARWRSPSVRPHPRCGPGWCRWGRVVAGSTRTSGSGTCSAPGSTTPTASSPHFSTSRSATGSGSRPSPTLACLVTVVELRRPHALVFRKTLPYGGTGNWTFERRRQGMKATRVLERRRGARPLPRIITPQRTSPLRGS
jgi:hypothetical protein